MSSKGRCCLSLLVLLLCAMMSVSGVQANGAIPENFSGKWTEYFEDGTKKSETSYKHGKKMGVSIQWYTSNCPMSVHYFENDKLNGPMIKWEKCEGIIAIGEYKNNRPWNGFFLVNPATANPITSTTVYESGLTYYVIEYTKGLPFKSLSRKMLDQQLKTKPIYKELLDRLQKNRMKSGS